MQMIELLDRRRVRRSVTHYDVCVRPFFLDVIQKQVPRFRLKAPCVLAVCCLKASEMIWRHTPAYERDECIQHGSGRNTNAKLLTVCRTIACSSSYRSVSVRRRPRRQEIRWKSRLEGRRHSREGVRTSLGLHSEDVPALVDGCSSQNVDTHCDIYRRLLLILF